jgi:hypothetical protein
MEQARQEMEAMESEQFAAIEQRMGRPLTEQEKESVRGEMAARLKRSRVSKLNQCCNS